MEEEILFDKIFQPSQSNNFIDYNVAIGYSQAALKFCDQQISIEQIKRILKKKYGPINDEGKLSIDFVDNDEFLREKPPKKPIDLNSMKFKKGKSLLTIFNEKKQNRSRIIKEQEEMKKLEKMSGKKNHSETPFGLSSDLNISINPFNKSSSNYLNGSSSFSLLNQSIENLPSHASDNNLMNQFNVNINQINNNHENVEIKEVEKMIEEPIQHILINTNQMEIVNQTDFSEEFEEDYYDEEEIDTRIDPITVEKTQQVVNNIIGTNQDLEKPYLRTTGKVQPEDVRPQHILEQSLVYVLEKAKQTNDIHYLSEQLKSIRQDIIIQKIENEFKRKVCNISIECELQHKNLFDAKSCIQFVLEHDKIFGITDELHYVYLTIVLMSSIKFFYSLLKSKGTEKQQSKEKAIHEFYTNIRSLNAHDFKHPIVLFGLHFIHSYLIGDIVTSYQLLNSTEIHKILRMYIETDIYDSLKIKAFENMKGNYGIESISVNEFVELFNFQNESEFIQFINDKKLLMNGVCELKNDNNLKFIVKMN